MKEGESMKLAGKEQRLLRWMITHCTLAALHVTEACLPTLAFVMVPWDE